MKTLHALMTARLRRFAGDESGTTAIEYALIAAGIGAAIAGTITLLGDKIAGLYESVKTALAA